MEQDGCAFHYDYPFPHRSLGPGCQFKDETEFFDCGDKRYCRFHLPMADDEGRATEKASWLSAGSDGPRLAAFRKKLEADLDEALEAERLVNFSGVVFPGDTDFSARAFPAILWYLTRFHGRANFNNVEFQSGADFRDAEFQSDADFTNSKFSAATVFQGSVFSRPPLFHNAPLHQDTRFNPGDGIAKQFPNIADDTAEQAYRTLKLHMAKNQAHREEQFFFAWR